MRQDALSRRRLKAATHSQDCSHLTGDNTTITKETPCELRWSVAGVLQQRWWIVVQRPDSATSHSEWRDVPRDTHPEGSSQ